MLQLESATLRLALVDMHRQISMQTCPVSYRIVKHSHNTHTYTYIIIKVWLACDIFLEFSSNFSPHLLHQLLLQHSTATSSLPHDHPQQPSSMLFFPTEFIFTQKDFDRNGQINIAVDFRAIGNKKPINSINNHLNKHNRILKITAKQRKFNFDKHVRALPQLHHRRNKKLILIFTPRFLLGCWLLLTIDIERHQHFQKMKLLSRESMHRNKSQMLSLPVLQELLLIPLA